ncbi:MAG: putative lipopolysaccharide heptosyltransferase III [Pseudomonadota bacterium]
MLKDPVPFAQIKRALVIKLRHHGDVLLSTPVFSALKKHAPRLEIDALVYADTAEMLSLHPAIEQLHTIDRNWKKSGILSQANAEWQLLRSLRARNYQLIVHLTEHPRGAWLTRLCRANWSVAPDLSKRGGFWRNSFSHLYSKPLNARRHTVERNLDALRRIGIYPAPEERQLTLQPGSAAEASMIMRLREQGLTTKGFIHIHPASRWHFKCWPSEQMAALINRLHAEAYVVVLSAAPDAAEMLMIERIQAQLSQPAISFAGQLSLKELAALTARAHVFLGVDSAPMHIAAAMGTPTVALFGPSGDQEWGPWGVAHRIVSSEVHSCRPCGIDGCGGGKVSDCLTALPVERVYQALKMLLTSAHG